MTKQKAVQLPRYSSHRLDNGDFVLWDNRTNSQVPFAGPYPSASAATIAVNRHNRAHENTQPRKIK